jgi:hypothetical protein
MEMFQMYQKYVKLLTIRKTFYVSGTMTGTKILVKTKEDIKNWELQV